MPRTAPRVRRRSRLWRVVRGVLALVSVVIAVAFVTIFSIDLGPSVRARAETRRRQLSQARLQDRQALHPPPPRRLRRRRHPHRRPDARPIRPFFTAKQVIVKMPWWTIIRRELIVESVDINDWAMVVERFADGRHTFPRLFPERRGPQGPRRFVTTVRVVRASRGSFTYDDHGAPWKVVAPNIQVVINKADTYRGTASFDKGTRQHRQVRADDGGDEVALQDRRRQDRPRPHRSDDGWGAVDGDGCRRHGAVAGTDLSRPVARRLPAHAGDLLRAGQVHAEG